VADIILTDEEIKRFWLKTRWNPTIGCLEWTAGGYGNGYGKFHIKRVATPAHRIAWVLENGQIPGGLLVCHKCDNPPCLNVDHLFLGTYADNLADMEAKGRGAWQGRTHCPNGHTFTPENLLPAKKGRKLCKICWGGYHAKYRDEHRERKNAYNAAYYAAHRDEIVAQKLVYNAANRERQRRYAAEKYAATSRLRSCSARSKQASCES